MKTLITSNGTPALAESAAQARMLCFGCSGSFNGPEFNQRQQADHEKDWSDRHVTEQRQGRNDGYVIVVLIILIVIMVVLANCMRRWYVNDIVHSCQKYQQSVAVHQDGEQQEKWRDCVATELHTGQSYERR
jgi:Na+-transporting methylmalonyl-CoA/oxaloacetate decarboxylase gamma subunit